MEATDLADRLRRDIELGGALPARDGFDDLDTRAGFDDTSFFIDVEGDTFVVLVTKVAD